MKQAWMMPWVAVAIPFIGAAFSLLLLSSLYRIKTVALSATAATLFAVMGLSWIANEPAAGMPFMWLLPLAAFFSLLGQPLHRDNRTAWLMTLILLGSGLGFLTVQEPVRHILLAALFGVLCGLIYRYHLDRRQNGLHPDVWRGLGSYVVGLVSALLALVLPAPLSSVAALIACATLLPLFPLHSGFIAALTGLPGNLPAFLVLLLPALGFHSLLLLLPNLTATILHTAALLALAGATYGSLRALIQPRALPRLSYAGFAFFSMLWWYVADTGTAPSQALVYLSAVGLAMSGLLLAWYSLRARYGDIDTRALGGLVYPMPRFSTLLVLLALAALGMPPFGVFSGFMGMLLNPAFTPSGSFAVIMMVWFCASWYFMDWVQELVFGTQRSDIRHEDLRRTELASLFMLLVLLLVLGTAPSRLFQAGAVMPPASSATQSVTWTP
jgi:NADH-quinone oxidoreductase subunit M